MDIFHTGEGMRADERLDPLEFSAGYVQNYSAGYLGTEHPFQFGGSGM